MQYTSPPNQGYFIAQAVLEMTGGAGVDIVLNVVGASSIEQCLKATRIGGAVVTVGILSDNPDQKVNVMQDILYGAKTVQGQVGAGNMEQLVAMVRFMEDHQLHPQIAEIFEFEEADKGLKALEDLKVPGTYSMNKFKKRLSNSRSYVRGTNGCFNHVSMDGSSFRTRSYTVPSASFSVFNAFVCRSTSAFSSTGGPGETC